MTNGEIWQEMYLGHVSLYALAKKMHISIYRLEKRLKRELKPKEKHQILTLVHKMSEY